MNSCQNCRDERSDKVVFLDKPLCADWKKCARQAGRTTFNKRRWSAQGPRSALTNPVYTERKPGYIVFGVTDKSRPAFQR